MRKRLVVVVAAGLVAGVQAEETTVPAAESIYVCDAASVTELNDEGSLEQTNFAKAVAMYESRFAVDRRTGVTMGGPFGTWDAKNIQVLSTGDDKEAFKAIWLAHAPFDHFKYLLIKSYVESAKKPFLGVSGHVVITGSCEATSGN